MKDNLTDHLKRIWAEYEKSKRDPVMLGFLGQPGAGKSSLINSIVGHPVAPVGVRTDYTKGPAIYTWNEICLVDLPGYGTEGFPKEGFLKRFNVLDFDALLCIANGKFRRDDADFFREVHAKGKPCLFVRTFAQALWQEGKTKDELKGDIGDDVKNLLSGADFQLLFVDNSTGDGISDLQDAIVGLLGPARRDKYYRWARGTSKAFLESKRKSCDKLIWWYAAGAAANGLNPVPGADVAVDLAIVGKMVFDIFSAFGFTREQLQEDLNRYEALRPIVALLLNALLKGGAEYLVGFAGAAAAKWVPFIGPALAGSAGLAVVYAAGQDFANRCYDLATKIR